MSILPQTATANEALAAETSAMIERCQSGEFSRADLLLEGMRVGWTPIPSRGFLTERFAALEAEGQDIGNQTPVVRNASDFEGIELYQTRTMLLLEEGNESVAFIANDFSEKEVWCTFTTTFDMAFPELEARFSDFASTRHQNSEFDINLTGPRGSFFSMTMMPDQSARPLSGAQMQIFLSSEQLE